MDAKNENPFRVIKIEETDTCEKQYLVVMDNQISTGKFCECYDRYGNKIGCYDAACWNEENAESLGEDWDGETYHTEAKYIEYWDGSNFQTFFLDIEGSCECDGELLEEDDQLAEKILSDYEKTYWSDWNAGFRSAETENFEFIQSQFAGAFEIATVKPI